MKIMISVNFEIAFFPIHQVINFVCSQINEKFKTGILPEQIRTKLKEAFYTDFYFTENPVVMALFFVWEAVRASVSWDGFLEVLDLKSNETNLVRALHDFEAAWVSYSPPTEEEITAGLNKFKKLTTFMNRAKRPNNSTHLGVPLINKNGTPVTYQWKAH